MHPEPDSLADAYAKALDMESKYAPPSKQQGVAGSRQRGSFRGAGRRLGGFQQQSQQRRYGYQSRPFFKRPYGPSAYQASVRRGPLTVFEKTKRMRENRCWYCGDLSHKLSECPRTCYGKRAEN